jgi:hypothetical protein
MVLVVAKIGVCADGLHGDTCYVSILIIDDL